MDWIAAALGSALLFAVVSALDKRILAFYVPTAHSFNVLVGVVQLLMAATVGLLVPWRSDPSAAFLAVGMASGALTGAALLFLFHGLRALEVSRAMPVYHTFPIFVALLAVPLLGEEISLARWGAILVTVAGAGLVTTGQNGDGRSNGATIAFLLILLASVSTAVSNVAYKYALEEIEFWNLLALRSLTTGAVMVAIPALRSGTMAEVRRVIAGRRGLGLLLLTEGAIAPVAVFLLVLALALGPVSLASTLMSTRPLFVLLISGLLSTRLWRLLDEPFTRQALPVKLVSTAMIVGGVSALTLA